MQPTLVSGGSGSVDFSPNTVTLTVVCDYLRRPLLASSSVSQCRSARGCSLRDCWRAAGRPWVAAGLNFCPTHHPCIIYSAIFN